MCSLLSIIWGAFDNYEADTFFHSLNPQKALQRPGLMWKGKLSVCSVLGVLQVWSGHHLPDSLHLVFSQPDLIFLWLPWFQRTLCPEWLCITLPGQGIGWNSKALWVFNTPRLWQKTFSCRVTALKTNSGREALPLMTLRSPLAVMPSWGMSLLLLLPCRVCEFYFISLPRRGFCFTGVKVITPESLHILPLFRNPPWILKCLLSLRVQSWKRLRPQCICFAVSWESESIRLHDSPKMDRLFHLENSTHFWCCPNHVV